MEVGDKDRDRVNGVDRDRDRDRDSDRVKDRDSSRYRDRDRDSDKDRERDKDSDRDRDRDRDSSHVRVSKHDQTADESDRVGIRMSDDTNSDTDLRDTSATSSPTASPVDNYREKYRDSDRTIDSDRAIDRIRSTRAVQKARRSLSQGVPLSDARWQPPWESYTQPYTQSVNVPFSPNMVGKDFGKPESNPLNNQSPVNRMISSKISNTFDFSLPSLPDWLTDSSGTKLSSSISGSIASVSSTEHQPYFLNDFNINSSPTSSPTAATKAQTGTTLHTTEQNSTAQLPSTLNVSIVNNSQLKSSKHLGNDFFSVPQLPEWLT